MKRALRRHHIERLKRKRKKYWYGNITEFEGLSKKHLNMVAKTPHPCSCPMCGNPRKHFNRLTIQEKKQIEKELEDL